MHAPPVNHAAPAYVSLPEPYIAYVHCRVRMLTEEFFNREANYDTANPAYIRKYLRTYGLTPPRAETYEVQKKRCMRLTLAYNVWRTLMSHDYRSGPAGSEVHSH